MIKPKTTTTDNGAAHMKKFIADMKKIKGSYVSIGVHEDAGKYTEGINPPEVYEVALWNEFGAKHGQEGEIPERSFIRSAIDDNEALLNKWRDELLLKLWMQTITLEKALETMGFRIMVLIQNKIKSNIPPENAESTRAAKERAGVPEQTLMNTTLLLRSITFKVHLA